MTLKELYKIGIESLKCKSDVILLMESIFGIDKLHLITCGNESVNNVDIFFEFLKRVKNGEPIQYVIGESEFLGIKLKVGKGVFIPRQETELLVKIVSDILGDDFSGNIVDLCSGSGAISIYLKKKLKLSNVWAIEKSEEAFKFLVENAEANRVKLNCILGDIFEESQKFENKTFDLIISNPPYVKTKDIEFLDKNVKFEPKIALDGGDDGLDFYRKIVRFWKEKLKPGALIAFELGINQHNEVFDIMSENEFENIRIFDDFSGIRRIIIGSKS